MDAAASFLASNPLLAAALALFLYWLLFRRASGGGGGGGAPATLDLVAGQIQLLTGTIPALLPFIRDGRVKPLAVTAARRNPVLPEVHGLTESGLAGTEVTNYFGLVAPRGTPAAVVERINEALPRILAQSDVQARFKTDALEPSRLGPQAQAAFIAQDYAGWQKVAAAQQIKLDSV
jgi:tripartite-type tricarboxylate transporter receptor subunit TctC